MGNYISCTLTVPAGKKLNTTKVIFPNGEIRQFQEPVKAAELMLEMPNFFLVNSQSLHMGRRFSALNADEDLEMASVYVMFPMKRVSSVVTAADMGVLFLAANSVAKGVSGGRRFRILPGSGEDSRVTSEDQMVDILREGAAEQAGPKLNLDDIEELSTPDVMHRLSMCRSKKPLLETIAEEPFCSR